MKKILILFIFSLLFLSSCSKEEIKEVKKYYKTTTSQSGSINNSESYIGYTEAITQVNLSTKSNGKITFLNGKIGDNVKKGELLARLDSSEAKVGYTSANNIISSLNSIKNYTSLSYDEQINIIQKKIEEIKQSQKAINRNNINLETLKDTQLHSGELLIKQAKTQLETNKIELEEAKNIYEGKKENIYRSGNSTITNSIILNTNIIYFADELLGITKENKDKNNSFEDYLGTKNRGVLNETIESFKETNKLFLEYKLYYENKIENLDPTNEEITLGLEKGLKISEKMKEFLNLLYKTVDSSIENVYLTLGTLRSYKEKISSFGNQLESQILSVNGNIASGLRGTKESLNSLELEYTKERKLIEQKINISEDNLESLIQNLDKINATSDISTDAEVSKNDILQKQIEGLLAQIEAIKSEKTSKLKEVENNIIEIKGEKNLAGVQIQNGNIYSPISGIIIKKLSEIGEIISFGKTIYIVGDDSEIKLKIEVPQKILSSISLGKDVNIQLDGIDKIITGKIISIPAVKNSITKKTTIEIVINNKEREIKIGTIAKVSIPLIEQKQNGIIIPNSAILQKFSIPGVYILEEGKAKFKKITILSQNEVFSEIKGIDVGKIIITEGKENIWDGEDLK